MPESVHRGGTSGPDVWAPVVGLALVAAANQMLWLDFTPITSGAATRLHVSQSAIGWLSEIFPLLYVVLAVPVGKALDRWFPATLLAGAVLNAVGAVVRVFGSHRYGLILGGQVLTAVAQPALLNAITGTASRYLSPERRPVGIAVTSAGTFAGFVAAFVLGGAFGAARLGWILDISAGCAVLSTAVLAAAVAPRLAQRAEVAAQEISALAVRELWGDRVLRILAGLVFVGFGAFVALSTWLETLLKPAGVRSGATDTLLTVMVLAGVAGCALIPPAVASRARQAPMLVVSAAAIVLSCLLLAATPGVAAGAVALPVLGFLLLPDLPIVLELAERRAGSSGGAATAVLWLSGNAGGIAIALVVQGLQSRPAAAFVVLAVAAVPAVPLALALGRRLGRPAQTAA